MLLHEKWNSVRRHAAIPSSFRINDHGGPFAANPQASYLGPLAGIPQLRILEFALESLPSPHAHFRRAAGRPRAQKHMAFITADAEFFDRFLEDSFLAMRHPFRKFEK